MNKIKHMQLMKQFFIYYPHSCIQKLGNALHTSRAYVVNLYMFSITGDALMWHLLNIIGWQLVMIISIAPTISFCLNFRWWVGKKILITDVQHLHLKNPNFCNSNQFLPIYTKSTAHNIDSLPECNYLSLNTFKQLKFKSPENFLNASN